MYCHKKGPLRIFAGSAVATEMEILILTFVEDQ